MLLTELTENLDDLLNAHGVGGDASNNGLQVEGKPEVKKAVFGVDACRDLFEEAVSGNADFVFTHHGISWRDSLKYITGMNAERLRLLLSSNISLYACHLPLDMHEEIGHNALIAKLLEVKEPEPFCEYSGVQIGFYGSLPQVLSISELASRVNHGLKTHCKTVFSGRESIQTVGIVSGSGADAIDECKSLGIDCLITGEMGHSDYYNAVENGIAILEAGHYKTEIPGILAVMEHVKAMGIDCEFIDLPTGF